MSRFSNLSRDFSIFAEDISRPTTCFCSGYCKEWRGCTYNIWRGSTGQFDCNPVLLPWKVAAWCTWFVDLSAAGRSLTRTWCVRTYIFFFLQVTGIQTTLWSRSFCDPTMVILHTISIGILAVCDTTHCDNLFLLLSYFGPAGSNAHVRGRRCVPL